MGTIAFLSKSLVPLEATSLSSQVSGFIKLEAYGLVMIAWTGPVSIRIRSMLPVKGLGRCWWGEAGVREDRDLCSLAFKK